MIRADEIDDKHVKMLSASLLINALRDLVTARRHMLQGQKYIKENNQTPILATLRFREALSWLSRCSPGNGDYISFVDVCTSLQLDENALRFHLLARLKYLEEIPSTLHLVNLIDYKALMESVK